MNIIQDLIIKQAYQDKFTEQQINLLKQSTESPYNIYLLYKKIYKGEYKENT